MKCKKLTLNDPDFPAVLRSIPTPPEQLYYTGVTLTELLKSPAVGMVGSRKATPYGRAVTSQLATELVRAGIVVVSGLALGVDSVAQTAAVNAGGKVIAVLPCGLDEIYPSTHRALARQIIEGGGCLISEYKEGTPPLKPHFIARNRLISGLSQALIITEAAAKSGSLHTAQFALEQGREVLAVPGNITSPTSEGTNNLIKVGATPVTSAADILNVLGIDQGQARPVMADTPEEATILDLLGSGLNDSDELLAASGIEPAAFGQTLTMLEINGKIKPLGNRQWRRL